MTPLAVEAMLENCIEKTLKNHVEWFFKKSSCLHCNLRMNQDYTWFHITIHQFESSNTLIGHHLHSQPSRCNFTHFCQFLNPNQWCWWVCETKLESNKSPSQDWLGYLKKRIKSRSNIQHDFSLPPTSPLTVPDD
jgi:hypothetical protein